MADNVDVIKKLRENSGAGLMACKKALEETNGDYEMAFDLLRKKGIIKAQDKSDRVTSEGLCCFVSNDNNFSLLKMCCETDFVARNEKFQDLTNKIANIALKNKINNKDDLLNVEEEGKKVSDIIAENIAFIGENVVVSDVITKNIQSGQIISYYTHNKIKDKDNLGGIISVIIANGNNDEKTKELLKHINMHIVAMSPVAMDEKNVPEEMVKKEREIYQEQVSQLNKPQEILQKMVDGKMRKFFEEKVLLKQVFVIDNKTKIEDVIKNFNKDNNSNLELISFNRISIK